MARRGYYRKTKSGKRVYVRPSGSGPPAGPRGPVSGSLAMKHAPSRNRLSPFQYKLGGATLTASAEFKKKKRGFLGHLQHLVTDQGGDARGIWNAGPYDEEQARYVLKHPRGAEGYTWGQKTENQARRKLGLPINVPDKPRKKRRRK